jgi:hypothetical protein
MWRPPLTCSCGNHVFAASSSWGVVLLSPQDSWLLEQFLWSLSIAGQHIAYAVSCRFARERSTSSLLHKAVLFAKKVDHENGNGLDCRRNNLRAATHADNMRNAKRKSSNRTGYKGVKYRAKYRKRWIAKIMVNRKDIHIGAFLTALEAARAYDEAAKKHFGPFARTNFSTDRGGPS